MSDATADMSLQESCIDAARHLSVEVHLLVSKADELERGNDKLRGLVDYMVPIAWYAASERERDRMRELGVEVDG